MDKSDPPTSARRSSSRREKQPPLRSPPHRSASVQASCDVASAAPPPARRTTGGRAVSLPPAGRARGNRRSAAASVLESTEVTPILDSFRTGNNAEIRAAIDNAFSVADDDIEAVVVGVDNSDGNSDDLFGVVDGHSYFGDHRNPNPEDPSDIEGPRPLTANVVAHRPSTRTAVLVAGVAQRPCRRGSRTLACHRRLDTEMTTTTTTTTTRCSVRR